MYVGILANFFSNTLFLVLIKFVPAVDENGVVGLRSQIQVELDSPDQSTIIVAAMPIKVRYFMDFYSEICVCLFLYLFVFVSMCVYL